MGKYEYTQMIFLRKTFIELSMTTNIIRFGWALRMHPLSVSSTLALGIFAITVGVTRRPKQSDMSGRRRRSDGYVYRDAA